MVTTHLTRETPIHPHNHLAIHPSKYHLIHLIHLTPAHLSLPGGQKWGRAQSLLLAGQTKPIVIIIIVSSSAINMIINILLIIAICANDQRLI